GPAPDVLPVAPVMTRDAVEFATAGLEAERTARVELAVPGAEAKDSAVDAWSGVAVRESGLLSGHRRQQQRGAADCEQDARRAPEEGRHRLLLHHREVGRGARARPGHGNAAQNPAGSAA